MLTLGSRASPSPVASHTYFMTPRYASSIVMSCSEEALSLSSPRQLPSALFASLFDASANHDCSFSSALEALSESALCLRMGRRRLII